MKTVAIIQARMGSTRFPGKVLADLCGKPVLKHVIDRVRQCELVDLVAVATSAEDDGDERAIAGHCREWGVEHAAFEVPAGNLLFRYTLAAHLWNADLLVRVCSDNPLICPREIDYLVNNAIGLGLDYATFLAPARPWSIVRHSTGYFAEVIRTKRLLEIGRLVTLGVEHVGPLFYWLPSRYLRLLELPTWYTEHNPPNAAIDTPEDLERVAAMLQDPKWRKVLRLDE